MSNIRVSIQLPKDLRRFSSRVRGLAEDVITVAAETIREQTVRRFRTKTSPDGGSWKSSQHGLQDTGRLMGSIRSIVNGLTARIGTNVVYGAVHQFGATIKPRRGDRLVFVGQGGGLVVARQVTIPARPYLGVSSSDAREIEQRVLGVVRALIG